MPWLSFLGAALLRGALIGVTFMVFGVVVHVATLGSGLTPDRLLTELAFDGCLGLFVATPASFLEQVGARGPRRHRKRVVLAVALVGFGGATAAYLQSHYTAAALRSGSLAEGLEAVLRAGSWLPLYLDMSGLFVSVSLVFTATVFTRLHELDLPTQCVTSLGLGLSTVAGVLSVAWPGMASAAISVTMLGMAGVAVPLLFRLGDRLEPLVMPARAEQEES